MRIGSSQELPELSFGTLLLKEGALEVIELGFALIDVFQCGSPRHQNKRNEGSMQDQQMDTSRTGRALNLL